MVRGQPIRVAAQAFGNSSLGKPNGERHTPSLARIAFGNVGVVVTRPSLDSTTCPPVAPRTAASLQRNVRKFHSSAYRIIGIRFESGFALSLQGLSA